MTSIKEKQVEKLLDKIIGNGDETLRIIRKLALTNNKLTPEIINTIEYLKKQNEEEVEAINQELEMTLDASGNLVPVSNITFTIENGVINNVNGVIEVPYRLPVGKT